MHFEHSPAGFFDLSNQNAHFGGWLVPASDPGAIVMAFPVEGWRTSAAVVVRQDAGGRVLGEVRGTDHDAPGAWQQALATLSLDCDGGGWAEIGRSDPLVGRLQESYKLLRPVLFHSPYEAAAAFVIGHRISVKQGRAVRQALSVAHGDRIEAGSESFHAFPRPDVLRGLSRIPGVSQAKVPRLHAIADAAVEGWLTREALRRMSEEQAIQRLRSLPGIGDFFSQGILFRGAGLSDAVPDDAVTQQAFQKAFRLADPPDRDTVLRLAQPWKPYRMWATVLLHVWLRREAGGPERKSPTRGRRRSADNAQ